MSSKTERPQVVLVSRCFVVRDDRRLLLVQRSPLDSNNPEKWECPGGKLDIGQDLSHAQEREVMEETGLLVKPSMVYTVDSFVIGTGKYKGLAYVVLFSVTNLLGGTLKLSEEHTTYAWVTYEEMFSYDLTQEVRRAAIILAQHLETLLWMVIHKDEYGNSGIIQQNMTKADAHNLALQYSKKRHKQTYFALSYTSATRNTLIKEHNILV